MGLPAEGLSRRRLKRLFPGPWRHRFVWGRGMTSDDTEHTILVGQSLLAHPNSVEGFSRHFAWCLRWWLASLPAGIGWATLRAILRLWLGFSPNRSGVYSAGNGPAMRSAVIGAFFASHPDLMEPYLEASSRITHRDPRALIGARAVARLTAWIVRDELGQRPTVESFLALLQQCGAEDAEWREVVEAIRSACDQDFTVERFAASLGLSGGVTGYIYHTVAVASYSWLRHFGDFEATLSAVLNCGGDTDTAGAIAGSLAGAVVGEKGISQSWKHGLWEWPRGRKFLIELADRLAESSHSLKSASRVIYFWPGVLPRNLFFMAMVLLHGLRRLAPPY